MHTYKSAEVAGVLGIILGGVGALDFYLENYRKMAVHIGLLVVSLGLIVVDVLVLPLSWSALELTEYAWVTSVLEFLTVTLVLGNFLGGAVEGILILVRGDDGLAKRGYRISNSRLQSKNARSVTVERKLAPSQSEGEIAVW